MNLFIMVLDYVHLSLWWYSIFPFAYNKCLITLIIQSASKLKEHVIRYKFLQLIRQDNDQNYEPQIFLDNSYVDCNLLNNYQKCVKKSLQYCIFQDFFCLLCLFSLLMPNFRTIIWKLQKQSKNTINFLFIFFVYTLVLLGSNIQICLKILKQYQNHV